MTGSNMPEPDTNPPANYAAATECIEQLKYFALEQDMASLLKIYMSGEDVIFECKILVYQYRTPSLVPRPSFWLG